MVNYSNLPARLRRIVKTYDYCVLTVTPTSFDAYQIQLKEGYSHRNGERHYMFLKEDESDGIITFFKNVVKPTNETIQVSMYGFKCPICGSYVSKGQNYILSGGLKVCIACTLE